MMFLHAVVVLTVAVISVAGTFIPSTIVRESGHATGGKVSSMVVKGIVIGTILFICTLLSLYLYRKCLFSTEPSTTSMLNIRSADRNPGAPSMSAAPTLALARYAGKLSSYVAFPPSTAGRNPDGVPLPAIPSVSGSARTPGMRAKIAAPVAGPRASFARKNVT